MLRYSGNDRRIIPECYPIGQSGVKNVAIPVRVSGTFTLFITQSWEYFSLIIEIIMVLTSNRNLTFITH